MELTAARKESAGLEGQLKEAREATDRTTEVCNISPPPFVPRTASAFIANFDGGCILIN